MSTKQNILLLLLSIGILGCGESNYGKRCKFQPGNLVRSVVSNQIGQIISMYDHGTKNKCRYNVRFHGSQSFTDSKVLSSDGPIVVKPLMVVKYMRPYELERVN